MAREEGEYRTFDVGLGGRVLQGQRVSSWERRSLPRRVTFENYVLGFSKSFARYAFLATCGLMGAALAALAGRGRIDAGAGWLLMAASTLAMGLLAAGAAGGLALVLRARTFELWMEELEQVTLAPQAVEEAEPPALPAGRATRVEIPSGDGRAASFLQPRPGEFANWAAAVLRDLDDAELGPHERTTLSQNTGMRRGWSREGYKDMLAQLRLLGWVEEGANRVPEPTGQGRRALSAWLQNKPPSPGG